MRGQDEQQEGIFSYISPEKRVPPDHPLRRLRGMVDTALKEMSPQFAGLYSRYGRPSIAPEKLLRALLLQVFYSVRSERLLMEQLGYNLLFRWFVGLSMDDEVWDVTVFTKNRERLLAGEIADEFFEQVVKQARAAGLLSDEHFTVDGTLIEAWANRRSFHPKDDPPAKGTGGGASGSDGIGNACGTRSGAGDVARVVEEAGGKRRAWRWKEGRVDAGSRQSLSGREIHQRVAADAGESARSGV